MIAELVGISVALKPCEAYYIPCGHRYIGAPDQLSRRLILDRLQPVFSKRSNPATYTDVWTHVRDLFAMLPESKLRQYEKGRFSFNVPGGRCEACGGAGLTTLEMNFLAPVEVICEECGGARFHAETLTIRWKGKSVHDVLEMTIDEAAAFFADIPKIARGLVAMQDVGLGYVRIGQPSTTLSGGEAQRVKLATELQRPASGKTFYVLDEPTTGLHFQDVVQLLDCFEALLAVGHSLVIVEHNLQLMRAADYIIDLGPGAADEGGQVVATGTPEQIAGTKRSQTGRFLAQALAETASHSD
jgi:excinuclease ABC subunit A